MNDLNDRYSNLFLNAYINRHAHTENLKMIEVYSPSGIWHVFLYLPLPVYKVPAIGVNTTKSTYTFTSVLRGTVSLQFWHVCSDGRGSRQN